MKKELSTLHNITLSFFYLFIFILPCSNWSQEDSGLHEIPSPEKIYLQLPSNIFTTDETIWFKSIIAKADFHELTDISGVLYVELINSEEKIVDSKTLKIANGIGSSFFELSPNYPPGTYLIRAYTAWNKNFESDFIFKKYIQLYAPSEKIKKDPIYNIVVEKKTDNTRWLNTTIDPMIIDSLHKKKVTLYIISEGQKDSLVLKKNKEDLFTYSHPIADTTQFISLQIKTKNIKSQLKTIVVDQDFLDFQFFPESGELVEGIPSKVGFKALDANGKGIEINGIIVNEKDEFITTFQSNPLGMGSFTLLQVKTATSYFAVITSQSEKGLHLKYPLPKVSALGSVLSVLKRQDNILVRVNSNYAKSDSVYIQVSSRGLDYFQIKGRLKDGVLKSSLLSNQLPEGIIAFNLLNKNKSPIVQRLYFNQRPENIIKISLKTSKQKYEQRELTTLDIEATTVDGLPINANASVLILNRDQMGEMQDVRENILSYFLLSSDLRGTIENPGYYFHKDLNRYQELDNLLLTQGWSKYNYTKPIKEIVYTLESQLSISGNVGGIFTEKRKKKAELTLMTFGNPKTFNTQTTDSLGRFKFNIEDSFGERLKILIQSASLKGKQKNYSVTLDKKELPFIGFKHEKLVQIVDSVVENYVQKNLERNRITNMFAMSSDVNQLDEVVINAYKLTPNRLKVMKEHGEPDIVINGKDIQAKEKKWSYGLYSVILFSFPNDIEIIRTPDFLYARVIKSVGPTLVVIDGKPVMSYNYSLIPGIPPSEVKSFEIIESAHKFSKLYMEVFPYVHPLEVPPFGSVIAIYTYSGKGLHGVSAPVGLLHTSIPVFSTTREYYSQKHENLTTLDWLKPDLRALVHWEPQVISDNNGKCSISFYNSDNIGRHIIVVEVITSTGEIGYKEIVYAVEKRSDKK